MNTQTFKNETELQSFAEKFAKEIDGMAGPQTIALTGDLGAGKTTFTKHFLKALGAKEEILSPTFVLLKNHHLPSAKHTTATHIDLYRLEDLEEIFTLGLAEDLKDTRKIILIEWAERIKEGLPSDTTWLEFHHGETEGERSLMIN
ncbi:MAG: tRNA (adenosine(37)-N6)-threonylcarbamoyltransferase complex ATPase subunit type 1 TsaE [Candidatus Harrisonbacteria bacterium CG10_big_fil_rev_8_21_14_0_10_44_23]|uniref:tRNA threonylcarbamoyladenosine biosynthesis protein TsaE n=1 Tax=Candidatus Harrisonbacteria bacterium CG10_big_fil_rev_8_21_14_0_10_44_23 TaxID=1974585 RepID=A0A2H0UQD1_9BACT|nr:MAG: tRNA (adenosine(37)-N6)-threonylcarbamoyltransferase complex ATPase subunit type 1 TsaE [Candidatus Harrisonbacteria bacterium CG10_big_fil_rev_8_21_14_0_10_44_23]